MNEVEFICPHCHEQYDYINLLDGELCPKCRLSVKMTADALRKEINEQYQQFLNELQNKKYCDPEDRQKMVDFCNKAEKLYK